jgi:fatty acid desaturase
MEEEPQVSMQVQDRPTRVGEEFRDDVRLRNELRKRLVEPKALAALTRIEPLRSSLSLACTFGMLGAAIVVAIAAWPQSLTASTAWPQLLLVALCIIVIGTGQHALFVLAHEAAHYRLYESRRLNDFFGRLAGTLGGVSMCTYRVTHRLHHNHLYGKEDPDIALNGGYPRGAGYLLRKLLVDLTGWTAPKTYAYFFGAPAINADTRHALRPLDDTSDALRLAARQDRWGVVAFHVAAPITAMAVGGWQGLALYMVLWVLPLATVLQAMLRLRAVAEHGAPAGYDSPLTAARTNLPGRGPLGWLLHRMLFPHHVNYHIEHHLYPAVPHYHLPALHKLLRAQGALDAAEVRSLPDTFRRIFAPRIPPGIAR